MSYLSVDQKLKKAQSFSRKGKIAEAIEQLQQILSDFPKNKRAEAAIAKLNERDNSQLRALPSDITKRITSMYTNGQFTKVAEYAEQLIKKFPSSLLLWNLKSSSEFRLNQLEKAEAGFRFINQLNPNYPDGYNSLGNVLRSLSRFDEAIENYEKTISLNPNHFHALYNLGLTFHSIGDFENAIENYKKTIELKPNFKEAYYRIGLAFRNAKFKNYKEELQHTMVSLLEKETLIHPSSIAHAAVTLLKQNPLIQSILRQTPTSDCLESIIMSVKTLSKQPLLMKLMSCCPIPDLEFEAALISIRRSILININDLSNNQAIVHFQNVLAHQCFINEYLFIEKEEETENIKILERSIKKSFQTGCQPSSNEILCIASYRPLNSYEMINKTTFQTESQTVIKLQVLDHELENRLQSEIPTLKKLNNKISLKVQSQYEKNPYPRWVMLGLPLRPNTIKEVVSQIALNLDNKEIESVVKPKVLIAGCGTGQHSIGTASRFKNADVLAIDLSRRSLAYAKRKTVELGIDNIRYMHADILNLKKSENKFHIIESSGVLHHMEDPTLGLTILSSCLNRGGLMKIGLYSEEARKHVVKIREEIRVSGLEPEDRQMKLFREQLKTSQNQHHKIIRNTSDFFSLSDFRDLVFHVQEHRFTIPQIKRHLSQLGLSFCGFEGTEVISKFRSVHPSSADLYDLDTWHRFEISNPWTFMGMYQFWCQKA